MVTRTTPILGVALDGAGAHPAAWHAARVELLGDEVVPRLQERGVFRNDYEGPTLCDRLGLARPTVSAHRHLAATDS